MITVYERAGKYTVNKNGGHTLHKRAAIKTQRALLTLMLQIAFTEDWRLFVHNSKYSYSYNFCSDIQTHI